MSDIRILDLEKRPDWHAMVTSFVCPECGAPVGDWCHEMPNGFVRGGKIRVDYHSKRKYLAATSWYNRGSANDAHSDAQESSSGAAGNGQNTEAGVSGLDAGTHPDHPAGTGLPEVNPNEAPPNRGVQNRVRGTRRKLEETDIQKAGN